MSKIKIILAEDYAIVRRGIASLLKLNPDFEIIAEVENGREAIQKVEALQPDIVLMDIGMPVLNGLEATAHIKKKFPHIKVLIVTVQESEEFILQIIVSGANGYVFKNSSPEALAHAVTIVAQTEKFFSPSLSPAEVQEYLKRVQDGNIAVDPLTPREKEILQLIAEGHSHFNIAGLLHLSVRTVDTHRNNIMQKLDIHDTATLVHYAVKRGLIEIKR